MTYANDHLCGMSTMPCSHPIRTSACLRQSILKLLANADQPLTTTQLVEVLQLRSIGPRIYSMLLAMQYEGLVDCFEASPWTWTSTGASPEPKQ